MKNNECWNCHTFFNPSRSDQMFCSKRCRQHYYYMNKFSNTDKYKMGKYLKQELDDVVKYILSSNDCYSYQKIWNQFQEYGLVNEDSLINNLKKRGYIVTDGKIIKLL